MAGSIIIRNFSKQFGDVQAVDDISLEVASAKLFGLIGPDGAGKTTTMRTVCTLLACEQGEILVDEMDVRTQVAAIRAILGYMPQRFSLYPDLTVEQNLVFFADLFGVAKDDRARRLKQLYHFSQLEPFKDRLANALSGGMKQKLALSCTLIHTPKILVLDEPTTGVDPVSRREFWEILRQLRDDGVTILVSTPYMDEAALCDQVAFMYNGSLLAQDRPDRIHNHFPFALYEATGTPLRALSQFFKNETQAQSVQIFGDRLHVSFEEKLKDSETNKLRSRAPSGLESFEQMEAGIEDTFLALMKSGEPAA